MPHRDADLQFCLEVATEAALESGKILTRHWGKLKQIREKTGPGNIVTEVDEASEAAILEIIQRYFPDHCFLCEESGIQRASQEKYMWAIDPLDGTTNYAHQFPLCAISIALLVDGYPEVGVIYNPFHQEIFQAARHRGATCNNASIHVSGVTQLENSLLSTGFAADHRDYASFYHLMNLSHGIRRSGSAAVDLAYLAAGRIDGYWQRGLSPWDMAAGIILVEEAGGKVTSYDGHHPAILESGAVLASNALLHESLSLEILKSWEDNLR